MVVNDDRRDLRSLGKRFTKRHLAEAELIANHLLSRSTMAGRLYFDDASSARLREECLYPEFNPDVRYYKQLTRRFGLANKALRIYPDECWSTYPEIYQLENPNRNTDWEKKVVSLIEDHDLFGVIHRADIMQGFGRYGGIMYGIDDGLAYDKPVRGVDTNGKRTIQNLNNNIIFLRPLDEESLRVSEVDKNPNSPRIGQPIMYEVDLSADTRTDGFIFPSDMNTSIKVHWTRIEHLADNILGSAWYGYPRLESVLNALLDAQKILGGSAEMFWKGAFPGLALEMLPNAPPGIDYATIKMQIDRYMEGLQRYIALDSMKARSLTPQIADPMNHLMVQLMVICAVISCPMRVFLGSESGHLASTQDKETWNQRVLGRQRLYLEPRVLRPIIRRLMLLGVLPTIKSFTINWKDLNATTDAERADFGLKVTQALMQYTINGVEKIMPLKEYLTLVLRFSNQEADAIVKGARESENPITKELWKSTMQSMKDATKKTGKLGNTNGLGA